MNVRVRYTCGLDQWVWACSIAAVISWSMPTSMAISDDAPTKNTGPTTNERSETSSAPASAPSQPQHGVLLHDAKAFAGYNLINPGRKQTFLFDNQGRIVHTWTSEANSGAAAYLLDNGHLFRPSEAANRNRKFQGPAVSGRFQVLDWDSNVVWDFEYHSDKRLPHHDAIKMPNGNILAICWEWVTEDEAVAAGRRPETVKDSHLQPDCVVEIKPTGKNTGEVVWEWRSWDHLIQDRDSTKANFGKVSDHPELFDINFIRGEEDLAGPPTNDANATNAANKDASDPTKPAAATPARKNPDWMHINAIAYNAELDQIALSSPNFSEIWIIDHSTTTEQAKTHAGGRWGKGGDILYRWGNPRAYRQGTAADQRLFFQHNIQWIAKGLPGEGHLLVFNNGAGRKPEEYSEVDEFVPPTDKDGNYIRPTNGPFGPAEPLWSYHAPNKKDFYSWFISGTQRLANGNTLINSGAVGVVFEVTPSKEVVWRFSNPLKQNSAPAPNAAPKKFETIAAESRDVLAMTPEQRRKLDEIDKDLTSRLSGFLKAEQLQVLFAADPNDGAILSHMPTGDYLIAFHREKLVVDDDQKRQLKKIEDEINPKIAELLNDTQKTLIADFKKGAFAPTPPRPGTNPNRQGNTLFRATRYAVDHPAFAGKTLMPGKTLVELEEELDKQRAEANKKP